MKLSPKSARSLGCFGIAGGLLLVPTFAQGGTKTWTSAVDGAWSDNTKWSPPGAPANGDDVVISVSGPTNYTVTLDTSPTVSTLTLGASSGNTLQTLFAASRTITLSGASQIDLTGVLALNGSTVTGTGNLANRGAGYLTNGMIHVPWINQGVLVCGFNNTFGGPFQNRAGSILRVLGLASVANADLTFTNAFTNNGLIELTSSNGPASATLHLSAGSLVNAAGGQIIVLPGGGGARTLDVQLDNQGTLNVGADLILNKSGADHLNSGIINLTGGNLNLNLNGTSPSFINTGRISLGAGLYLTVSGGVFTHNAGTIDGTGTIFLINTTAGFTPNFQNSVTSLALNNCTVNGPGMISNVTTLIPTNCTINAPLINQGVLACVYVNTFAGGLQNLSGGTLRVWGLGGTANADLTVSSITNNGLLELTSSNGVAATTLHVNAGSLVNAAAGQVNVLAGGGGARTLDAQLDNQGTLNVGANLTLSKASSDHLNSGTINLSGGNFTLTQTGTSPSFLNTGTIHIGGSLFFIVSNGSFAHNAGSIDGAGTLFLFGTTASFTQNFENSVTTLTLNNCTLNGLGTITNVTALIPTNCTINAQLINRGVLTCVYNNTFGGPFQSQNGSTLRILGLGGTANADLTVSNGFTNNGVLELTSSNGVAASTLHVNAGSLVIAAASQVNVLTGGGGARALDAQLENQGTLNVGANLAVNKSSADHLNNGTINLTGGNLNLTQNGTSPGFLNTGRIHLGRGLFFGVSSGTFDYEAGSIDGAGTLFLLNATANFTPNFQNSVTTLTLNNSTLNGPGSINNVTTLAPTNCTFNTALINQGLLVCVYNNTFAGPFQNQAGSTLRLLGLGGTANADVVVPGSWTNGGLVELTSTNGLASATLHIGAGSLFNIAGSQIQALAGSGGARTLEAQLNNQGTIHVGTDLTVNKVSADHLNRGTIHVSDGDLNLFQSITSPTFTNAGTIHIGSNRTFRILAGTVQNTEAGILEGQGTLNVATASFSNAGSVNPGTSPGALTVAGDFPPNRHRQAEHRTGRHGSRHAIRPAQRHEQRQPGRNAGGEICRRLPDHDPDWSRLHCIDRRRIPRGRLGQCRERRTTLYDGWFRFLPGHLQRPHEDSRLERVPTHPASRRRFSGQSHQRQRPPDGFLRQFDQRLSHELSLGLRRWNLERAGQPVPCLQPGG